MITNHHVIEHHLTSGVDVQALTEDGQVYRLDLLSYSDKGNFDYAIFKVRNQISKDRVILKPRPQDYVNRGTEICFSDIHMELMIC